MVNRGVAPFDPTTAVGVIYGVSCTCHPERGYMYVGQARNLKRRVSGHFSEARKNPTAFALYPWMNKHGLENIVFTVLEEVPYDELNNREIYWIDAYDTFNDKGKLNLSSGGDTHRYSVESRVKMSQSAKRRWESADGSERATRLEQLARVAESNRGRDYSKRPFTRKSWETHPRGESHYKAKITEAEAVYIYYTFRSNPHITQKQIADRLGVSHGVVNKLCLKASWKQLTDRMDIDYGWAA